MEQMRFAGMTQVHWQDHGHRACRAAGPTGRAGALPGADDGVRTSTAVHAWIR